MITCTLRFERSEEAEGLYPTLSPVGGQGARRIDGDLRHCRPAQRTGPSGAVHVETRLGFRLG